MQAIHEQKEAAEVGKNRDCHRRPLCEDRQREASDPQEIEHNDKQGVH
jgi:hypothetical protein